jgi:hypothetical protein
MAFERFTRTRTRVSTPKASIWSRGQIGFNQGATEKFNLTSFDYAVIFYDKDTKRVGIRFTKDENEEGATKIIKRPSGGVSFSATAFLNVYGIDHSETRTYNVEYDEENELYVIDLKKTAQKA